MKSFWRQRTPCSPESISRTIAETASQTNTLVVLPTGLGKTMIAMLVAKARLEKFPKGKVVMLAPTRPLVLQHYETFKRMLKFDEGEAVGHDRRNRPSGTELSLEEVPVRLRDPQTVRNDLKGGRIELNDTVLLVFDEAHRSVKDYSYTQLATMYKEQGLDPADSWSDSLPRRLEGEGGGDNEESLHREGGGPDMKRTRTSNPTSNRRNLKESRSRFPRNTPLSSTLYGSLQREGDQAGRGRFHPKEPHLEEDSAAGTGHHLARLRSAEASGSGKGYIFGALISQAQAIIIIHAIELLETQGLGVLQKYLVRLRERPEQGKSAQALLKDERWAIIEEEAKKLRDIPYPEAREAR